MWKGGKKGRHARNREKTEERERKKGIKVETEIEGGERGKKKRERETIKRGSKVSIRRSVDTIKPFWRFCKWEKN